MLTNPICCYLYPGGSSPPPIPHPLSFHPPPLLLLPGNLGLQLPFRAAKAARYPHRSWSERRRCRAAWREGEEALLLDEAKQPCPALPGEKHPAAKGFAVLLLVPCSKVGSFHLPRECRAAVPGGANLCSAPCLLESLTWKAVHGQPRAGPGPQDPTALGVILGRAVSIQGSLVLLGKLWLHLALEVELLVL